MLCKVLKGMKDVLPAESARWRALEREMRKAALLNGYREIRTPVVEHTELFARSAGESSDVVRKEMYTFLDKGDRSVPIKLWQVPEVSPYFHHAHLLIAADCSAFACPTFHDKLSKGKVPLLCCPATDFDIATKLEKIFSHNEIASITVVKLEKACCQDMLECVFRAAKMSRLPIPIQVTNLFIEAEDVTQ